MAYDQTFTITWEINHIHFTQYNEKYPKLYQYRQYIHQFRQNIQKRDTSVSEGTI